MSRRSSEGERSRTERSPTRVSPSVISTMRLTMRIAVVLPHPDGPTNTQISPVNLDVELVDRGVVRAGVDLRRFAECDRQRLGVSCRSVGGIPGQVCVRMLNP